MIDFLLELETIQKDQDVSFIIAISEGCLNIVEITLNIFLIVSIYEIKRSKFPKILLESFLIKVLEAKKERGVE